MLLLDELPDPPYEDDPLSEDEPPYEDDPFPEDEPPYEDEPPPFIACWDEFIAFEVPEDMEFWLEPLIEFEEASCAEARAF